MADPNNNMNPGKAVLKMGDTIIGQYDNVIVDDATTAHFIPGGTIAAPTTTTTTDYTIPYPVPQIQPVPENLDLSPEQLEAYVKEYFENCFGKEGTAVVQPKMPEKVVEQMKIPGIKEISGSRKLKMNGDNK